MKKIVMDYEKKQQKEDREPDKAHRTARPIRKARASTGARYVYVQLLYAWHVICGYGFPAQGRPEIWHAELLPTKNQPAPDHRVASGAAGHHRQICPPHPQHALSAAHHSQNRQKGTGNYFKTKGIAKSFHIPVAIKLSAKNSCT